jgi:hypothetical protein
MLPPAPQAVRAGMNNGQQEGGTGERDEPRTLRGDTVAKQEIERGFPCSFDQAQWIRQKIKSTWGMEDRNRW